MTDYLTIHTHTAAHIYTYTFSWLFLRLGIVMDLMFVSPQNSYIEKKIKNSNAMVFGSKAFGRSQGHEDGAFMMELVPW